MSRQRVVVLLIGLMVTAGLCTVVCCGGLVHFGMGMAAEEVRGKLEADPRFVEHVGQIQEFGVDWVASLGNDDDDVFAYNVKGSKWSGRVTVKHETDDAGDERIIWARFTLASGEPVELTPVATGSEQADGT